MLFGLSNLICHCWYGETSRCLKTAHVISINNDRYVAVMNIGHMDQCPLSLLKPCFNEPPSVKKNWLVWLRCHPTGALFCQEPDNLPTEGGAILNVSYLEGSIRWRLWRSSVSQCLARGWDCWYRCCWQLRVCWPTMLFRVENRDGDRLGAGSIEGSMASIEMNF